MPSLFALAQHDSLMAAQSQLNEDDFLLAFLDDLYIVTSHDRARAAFDVVTSEVASGAGVRTHLGKLRLWSKNGGDCPDGFTGFESEIWTGNAQPEYCGIKVLGTPLGHPGFVDAHARGRLEEEQRFLNKLPRLADLQCAWLLLSYCAVPRANHLLRVLPPGVVAAYANCHDNAVWDCFCRLLGSERHSSDQLARAVSTLPGRLGGLGLRSAARTSPAAYWAAWVDSAQVLAEKAPRVHALFLSQAAMERPSADCIQALRDAQLTLAEEGCAMMPTWQAAALGAKAPYPDNPDAGEWRRGWQYHASSAREHHFSERVVLPSSCRSRRAMLLSQAGYGASKWLSTIPSCPGTVLRPLRMQVALRRRLRWPLPIGPRFCNGRSCRKQLDQLGDHWASCMRSGRVRRRARPLEKACARIFREAGARVQENVLLRDLVLPSARPTDRRALEVVATGLPVARGVPLAVDVTTVSVLHSDGRPWAEADVVAGICLERGERAKETTYPELVDSTDVRLTTMACEVGGRWSTACADLLAQLAAARARAAPRHLQLAARLAYEARWLSLLSCAQQDALAASLVDDTILTLEHGVSAEPPVIDAIIAMGRA